MKNYSVGCEGNKIVFVSEKSSENEIFDEWMEMLEVNIPLEDEYKPIQAKKPKRRKVKSKTI